MKKFLWSFAFLFVFTSICFGFKGPKDRDGIKAWNLQEVGVRTFSVRYSSAASGIAGSTIAIYGILTSTKTTAANSVQSFVEIRATNTANLTSELLFPAVEFSSTTRNTFVQFDPPFIAPDGFSVNITTVADAFATVFYRFLTTNTVENFWIPLDEDGVKSHDSAFYGIKAASEVVSGATADSLGTEALDYTTDERVVLTSPGLFYGTMASTGAVNSFVVFEDSASITGNANDLLPPLFYNAMTYEHFQNGNIAKVFRFPWPIILENGLTAARNVATDRFRVFIRRRGTIRY